MDLINKIIKLLLSVFSKPTIPEGKKDNPVLVTTSTVPPQVEVLSESGKSLGKIPASTVNPPLIIIPLGFNKNFIFNDRCFKHTPDFKTHDYFLNVGSCLSKIKIGDKWCGDVIDMVSIQFSVPQEVFIIRLDCEQGLVSRKDPPPQKVLDRCLGFGCTDSGDIEKYLGFENQIRSAGNQIKIMFKDGATRLGIKYTVDSDKDGTCDYVYPETQFTYAIYRYTPWIGWKPHVTLNGVKVGHDGYAYGALDTWKYARKRFPYMIEK
jgi:hypothetical protein